MRMSTHWHEGLWTMLLALSASYAIAATIVLT